MIKRVIRFIFPNDAWYGHLFTLTLYGGIAYASYWMFMLWPWWKAALMIPLQLALGLLSVPFLEMIFPARSGPPQSKESTHEETTITNGSVGPATNKRPSEGR